jgi:hypothetical protein
MGLDKKLTMTISCHIWYSVKPLLCQCFKGVEMGYTQIFFKM